MIDFLNRRILVVDDDSGIRRLLTTYKPFDLGTLLAAVTTCLDHFDAPTPALAA